MLDHDNLEDFRDAEEYDLVVGDYNDDRPLVEPWARSVGSPLLDLACGTGRMTIQLAQLGLDVMGVDVTPEMMALAKKKAAAQSLALEWVQADARSFQLGRQFAGIFMLENVFQFLPTRADQEAMLARVREHLLPGGQFLFETRNPQPRFLFATLHPEEQTFTLPDGRRLVVNETQTYDPITQIQHYRTERRTHYPDGSEATKLIRVALRYVFPQEMEALLHYNGLQIRAVYGDWRQSPLTADSPAMIYVCERRV